MARPKNRTHDRQSARQMFLQLDHRSDLDKSWNKKNDLVHLIFLFVFYLFLFLHIKEN